jgi:hypothetical protein
MQLAWKATITTAIATVDVTAAVSSSSIKGGKKYSSSSIDSFPVKNHFFW